MEEGPATALAPTTVVAVAFRARENAAPIRAVAIVACTVCAIAALTLAFTTFMDVSMDGFPDGHVTDMGKRSTHL
jgi:hypothetical protein